MSMIFRLGASAIGLVFSANLLACSSGATDTPVSPSGPAPLAEAAYSVTMFEPLAGEERSSVAAVNNSGVFVGQGTSPAFSGFRQRAFVAVRGNLVKLSQTPQSTLVAGGGISDGAIVYVVGAIDTVSSGLSSGATLPVRWALQQGGEPEMRILSGELGFASGVNDAGDVAGSVGNNAYLWPNSESAIVIPPPSGFTSATGKAVNNSGDAILVFSSSADVKSFLRRPSGC